MEGSKRKPEISHKNRERIYIVGFDNKEAYDIWIPGNQQLVDAPLLSRSVSTTSWSLATSQE